MESPTISSPRSFNRNAAADESTPPLIATAIIESEPLQNLVNGLRCQNAAVDLRCRQASERLCNLFLRDASRIGDVHSDEHFRGIGTRRDGGAAALRLELRVLDPAAIHFLPQLH